MSEQFKLIRFVRARVARLESNGTPDVGPGNLYVTNSQISLAMGFSNEAGDDFTQKNGGGEICYSLLEPEKFKNVTLSLSLCDHDPEWQELLVGGDIIQVALETIGYALPAVGTSGNQDGVSFEGWTINQLGSGINPDYPYVQWVFPKTLWTPADKTLENAPIPNAFTGVGYENANYLDGPGNDHPDPSVSDRLYSYFGVTEIPAATDGAQTLVAS